MNPCRFSFKVAHPGLGAKEKLPVSALCFLQMVSCRGAASFNQLAKAMCQKWEQPQSWVIEPVQPWTTDSVFYRLGENTAVANNVTKVGEILAATGGIHRIVDQEVAQDIDGRAVDSLRKIVAARFGNRLDNLLMEFGLPAEFCGKDGDRIRAWLDQLNGEQRYDLSDTFEPGQIQRHEFLVMKWIGLIQEAADGTWRVPQIYLDLAE